MSPPPKDCRVAMLVHNDFQDDQFREPLMILRRAGYDVCILGPEAQKAYRGRNLRERTTSDGGLDTARPQDYDALVIPGGYAPDRLRLVPGIADFVRHFVEHGKLVAAICHGPQLLISADVLRGRRCACFESIAVDVRNAGATVVDEPVVIDECIVTSRKTADLPQFCEAVLSLLTERETQQHSCRSSRG